MTVSKMQAAFFASVLGLAGLGNAWRTAHVTWGLSPLFGEALEGVAVVVWAVLLVVYILKWIFAREAALAELRHPIACCYIGLAGVSTILISLAVLPYSKDLAWPLFVAGATFTIGFGIWRTGRLWQGGRALGETTPVLYLPTVAGSFVTATAASAFGLADVAKLAFGAGLMSWLAIESTILIRLYTEPPMSLPLRPSLGIQLAPPVVGLVAYMSVSIGPPDLWAHVFLGYGLFQAAILLRTLPWILQQSFVPGFWSFTFGATALGAAPLRMMQHGEGGLVASLAPVLFFGANMVVAMIALATVYRFVVGWLGRRPPSAGPLAAPSA